MKRILLNIIKRKNLHIKVVEESNTYLSGLVDSHQYTQQDLDRCRKENQIFIDELYKKGISPWDIKAYNELS